MRAFQKILVYAGTEQHETTVPAAIELAVENKARLTLMDVVKPIPKALGMMTDVAKPEELERLVAADRRRRLLEIAESFSNANVPMDVVVAIGDPATEITRQVINDEHDLVIKMADGSSPANRLFGSIARSILRICPCPVWLLKPQAHGDFDQVLAAIDVNSEDQQHVDLNRKILELAYTIAQRDKAQLHVVAAWQLWMEDSIRRHAGDEAVDSIRKDHQAKVHSALDELLQTPYAEADDVHLHLRHGSPAAVIRSVADEVQADLMVMGTVCRTGVAGFLIGNTAETVIPDLTCSLLALKPDGFVSPVEASHTLLIEDDEPLPLL
ncbi:Universal stress protein E [Rubripirellula lacrimiformis]|uniref:Universal stress protein E n=1 Tax=Rubripirellula lacrimiformis TaxID=1930273 RepID=A0A517N4P0_9BACT|nr:universal stress protein [Rubripirellula lacrimiformis]QDT02101.1 Universal stress protein E [Rubripirellula lacrimiformis]